MAPLLLLSIAVMAAGVNRLQHWFQWSRSASSRIDELRQCLQGLQPLDAERELNQRLRRLDRRFRRWEPVLIWPWSWALSWGFSARSLA